MKWKRSYGEKHGKNRRRRKIETEEVGQGRNRENNTIVVYSLDHTTSVESNMPEKKLFFLFNAKDESSKFFQQLDMSKFQSPYKISYATGQFYP